MCDDEDNGELPKPVSLNEDNAILDQAKFKKKTHQRTDPDHSQGRPPSEQIRTILRDDLPGSGPMWMARVEVRAWVVSLMKEQLAPTFSCVLAQGRSIIS
jgi:hypothetical protein